MNGIIVVLGEIFVFVGVKYEYYIFDWFCNGENFLMVKLCIELYFLIVVI